MRRPPLLPLIALGLAAAGCPKSKPAWETPPTPPTPLPGSATPVTASGAILPKGPWLLGNPDSASADASSREKYLIERPQYALSYNDDLHFPNWVAWHLSRADIGDTDRGDFAPDPDLPEDFKRIVPRDYTGTGYDRGHNCPSKDRSASRQDNDAVFYMTNMTPQKHGMNAGAWENLERYCRELTASGKECYIVCGHGFEHSGEPRRVGRAGIAVPDFGWKVVIVLPEAGGDDRARIDAGTRIIAVKIPNIDGLDRAPWERFIVPPAEIEHATGLKLLDGLPAPVASALRGKLDSGGGSFSSSSQSGVKRKKRPTNGGSFGGNSFGR